MKKRVVFLTVLLLLSSMVFAQKADYKSLLKKAKIFEGTGKYVSALGAYWDAMEADPTKNAKEALEAFYTLSDFIESGYPGRKSDYDDFDLYGRWEKIFDEYEAYWKENIPYSVMFWYPKIEKLDTAKKTATYSVKAEVFGNYKFDTISTILMEGYDAGDVEDLGLEWRNLPSTDFTVSFKVVDKDDKILIPEQKINLSSSTCGTGECEKVICPGISREAKEVLDSYEGRIVVTELVYDGNKLPIEKIRFEDGIEGGVIDKNIIPYVEMSDFTWYANVKGGTFQMGSTEGKGDEVPVHSVTLNPYVIGTTEVTQNLYESVMGENPAYSVSPFKPVNNVTWYDAVEFCNKLSSKDGLTPCYKIDKDNDDPNNKNDDDYMKWTVTCDFSANGWRLPTEAEWEYAAIGGASKAKHRFSGSDDIDDVAWYFENSDDDSHNVAQKEPNELGLYDMSGNVFEWCWDWNGSYTSSAQKNPTGSSSGVGHMIRGGGYLHTEDETCIYRRYYDSPDYSAENLGFRIVRSGALK